MKYSGTQPKLIARAISTTISVLPIANSPLGDTGRPGASYAQPPPAFTGLVVFAFWVALDRTSTEGFLDAMV